MPRTKPTESEPGLLPPAGLAPEPLGAGLIWRLPTRPWGAGRWIPTLLFLVGAGLLAFAVHGGLRGAGLRPAVVFGGFAGGVLGLLGGVLRFSRGVIELNGDELRAGDRLLGFGWMRRYPTTGLRRLEVFTSTSQTNEGDVKPLPNVGMLLGSEPSEGKPVKTLASLSRSELSWLAAEIRRRTGLPSQAED